MWIFYIHEKNGETKGIIKIFSLNISHVEKLQI